MPVPAHNRITFSGTFGPPSAPLEQWSFRVCTGPRVFASAAERQAAADWARTVYTANIAPHMPNDVHLTRTRVSQHLAGGLTAQDDEGGYYQADDLTVVPGTRVDSAHPVMPIQTALCVSLDTNRDGPRGKGRFFLPFPGYSLDSDYRLTAQTTGVLAGSLVAFLNGLNDDVIVPGSQDDVCVVSSFGFVTRVTGIRVGRTPDTMRSRRGDLAEGYVPLPLT